MPFRELAWEFGGLDYAYTEMLSANHIYHGGKQNPRYIKKAKTEGPLCYQLAGNSTKALAFATEKAVTWGADLIDLNCGCPKTKIRKKNLGSQLLANSKHLYELIKAIQSACDIPVLVKIRIDGSSKDQFNLDVAKSVEDAGAAALTVHGRHWTENYETPVLYQQIAEIKQAITIPVVGNGDVKDCVSAQKMFAETNCDAIMIARASVGQPWLFAQIAAELQGKSFVPPNLSERGKLLLRHVDALIQLDGLQPALYQSRSLAKYYLRTDATDQALKEFYQTDTWETFKALIAKHC